ncbi:hypothetical protein HPP92_008707 [Vanilla planifolia]|uniref:DUF1677 family protein n=1 Tax=Vanilla planifolia TaxID=51239 RepID=A0A835V4R3_VANPL|nr:hypothetical protein HPP92_008707 [Vanilla planifolia]
MAPCGETHASGGASSKGGHAGKKPQRTQQPQQADGLQRAMSDLSLQLNRGGLQRDAGKLPPISEVENANCECCGMSEECTPEYIRRVRARFCGRWICGLCSEAVKEEMQKKEGKEEEALHAHMALCSRFNKFGRTHPVLFQAEAMRDILRKCSSSPKDGGRLVAGKKGGITRTSSCIPAITKETNGRARSLLMN